MLRCEGRSDAARRHQQDGSHCESQALWQRARRGPRVLARGAALSSPGAKNRVVSPRPGLESVKISQSSSVRPCLRIRKLRVGLWSKNKRWQPPEPLSKGRPSPPQLGTPQRGVGTGPASLPPCLPPSFHASSLVTGTITQGFTHV